MSTSLGFALIFAVAFIGLSSAQSPSSIVSHRCGDNEVYETCWRRSFAPDEECNSRRQRMCEPRCRCRSGYSRFRGRCIPSNRCPIVRNPRQNSSTMNLNQTDNSTVNINETEIVSAQQLIVNLNVNSSQTSSNNSTMNINSTMNFNETEILSAQQLIVNLTRSSLCEMNGTDGFFPVKGNCTQYVLCVIGTATILDCPKDLVFSNDIQRCVPKELAPEPCGTLKKDENGGKNETHSTSLQIDKEFDSFCTAKGSNGLFSDPKACSRAIACVDEKATVIECLEENKNYFNSTTLQCTELPEYLDNSCVAKPRHPRFILPFVGGVVACKLFKIC